MSRYRSRLCTETLTVPFGFQDYDLLFRVEVGREDFNLLSVERDGPGAPIDSDALKAAIEADAKEFERLEDASRQQWIDEMAGKAEDAEEARADWLNDVAKDERFDQ